MERQTDGHSNSSKSPLLCSNGIIMNNVGVLWTDPYNMQICLKDLRRAKYKQICSVIIAPSHYMNNLTINHGLPSHGYLTESCRCDAESTSITVFSIFLMKRKNI